MAAVGKSLAIDNAEIDELDGGPRDLGEFTAFFEQRIRARLLAALGDDAGHI